MQAMNWIILLKSSSCGPFLCMCFLFYCYVAVLLHVKGINLLSPVSVHLGPLSISLELYDLLFPYHMLSEP